MKIKLDSPLLNEDETPALEKEVPVTVRTVLIRAVLSDIDDSLQPVKGEEKVKRYNLYRTIKKGTDETDFEVEDVALLRKAVLIFPPLVAGQVREALN